MCVVCRDTLAVMNEGNLKHHYSWEHAAKLDGLLDALALGYVKTPSSHVLKHIKIICYALYFVFNIMNPKKSLKKPIHSLSHIEEF